MTPSGSDDGLLKGAEILRLRVPADLVALSACETARGRVFRAEGVVGLVRAFLFAGTPQVLCSLWKVDDAATQELMVEFDRRWRDGGEPAAAALRGAQEHVRAEKRWRHPYYWAAWVLWGPGD